jgi:hypothetical protein
MIAELMSPKIGWGRINAPTLGSVKVPELALVEATNRMMAGALAIRFVHSLGPWTTMMKMAMLCGIMEVLATGKVLTTTLTQLK